MVRSTGNLSSDDNVFVAKVQLGPIFGKSELSVD